MFLVAWVQQRGVEHNVEIEVFLKRKAPGHNWSNSGAGLGTTTGRSN